MTTRERILAAAVEAFATRGEAGARMDDIAARARVNKQAPYYHFGDKRQLFAAVLAEELVHKAALRTATPADVADALVFWFDAMRAQPTYLRLLQWEALEQEVPDATAAEPVGARERAAAYRDAVETLATRAHLHPDLDPGFVLLALLGLSSFPIAFPQVAELVTGSTPSDEEFVRRYQRVLRQLARALKEPEPVDAEGDGDRPRRPSADPAGEHTPWRESDSPPAR